MRLHHPPFLFMVALSQLFLNETAFLQWKSRASPSTCMEADWSSAPANALPRSSKWEERLTCDQTLQQTELQTKGVCSSAAGPYNMYIAYMQTYIVAQIMRICFLFFCKTTLKGTHLLFEGFFSSHLYLLMRFCYQETSNIFLSLWIKDWTLDLF